MTTAATTTTPMAVQNHHFFQMGGFSSVRATGAALGSLAAGVVTGGTGVVVGGGVVVTGGGVVVGSPTPCGSTVLVGGEVLAFSSAAMASWSLPICSRTAG